jgi:hypothetical protein
MKKKGKELNPTVLCRTIPILYHIFFYSLASLGFPPLHSAAETIPVNIDNLYRGILTVGGCTELMMHLKVTGLNLLRKLLKIRALRGLLPGRDFEHDLHFFEGSAFGFRS